MTHATLSTASSLIIQFQWPELAGLKVLDLACGSGRNGLWFLNQSCEVTFIDQDLSTLVKLTHDKAHQWQWNLEDGSASLLPQDTFDIVLVFNYLHRPLFPQIAASLKLGGLIVYETFTWQQAEIGRPRNPDFLLKEHELQSVFANWQPLHYFEGRLSDAVTGIESAKAQLIARKPLQ